MQPAVHFFFRLTAERTRWYCKRVDGNNGKALKVVDAIGVSAAAQLYNAAHIMHTA
jgi:hypothetical protein